MRGLRILYAVAAAVNGAVAVFTIQVIATRRVVLAPVLVVGDFLLVVAMGLAAFVFTRAAYGKPLAMKLILLVALLSLLWAGIWEVFGREAMAFGTAPS